MSAENDVANYLNTEGLGVLGVDLFTGPVRPSSVHVATNALFVLGGAGPEASRYLSGGAKIENRYPSVQVTIRNVDYDLGLVKAIEVHNALQAATIPGYWDVNVTASAPLYVSYNDSTYRWSVNCILSTRVEGWHGSGS